MYCADGGYFITSLLCTLYLYSWFFLIKVFGLSSMKNGHKWGNEAFFLGGNKGGLVEQNSI